MSFIGFKLFWGKKGFIKWVQHDGFWGSREYTSIWHWQLIHDWPASTIIIQTQ